ncbi:uncharacterized protein LOC6546252 [Drosophila erecta]|uniref:Reticulon-like protein n=1 Tax=Drosophila erecta TaxID=7220 RepID=B3ND92_DROER|nr:uncharacterized protein LOC6546252 [Drosophila erecta]EDV51885.2 uncharacterized protein Dere_GG15756 [Drosophila erecta]
MANTASPVPVSAPDAEVNENKSLCEGITKLILWRNWRNSLLVFGILQALMYDLFSEPALFVVSVWALTIMIISMGYRLCVQCLHLIKRTDIQNNSYPKYLDIDLSISLEQSRELGVLIQTKTEGFLNNLREVLILKSFWRTFKWFGILLLIIIYGKSINFLMVSQLGLVLLFTIPKMFEIKSRFAKFIRLPKCIKQFQITKVSNPKTPDALDMESLSEGNEETMKQIEKQTEDMELSTKESQDAGDDLKTFEAKEEICSDDFERLADSWSDEEILSDQTN